METQQSLNRDKKKQDTVAQVLLMKIVQEGENKKKCHTNLVCERREQQQVFRWKLREDVKFMREIF